MRDEETGQPLEVQVDARSLYREETFTDLKVAWIRRLTPVNPDGSPDPSRETAFLGESQLMSPAGPIPVQCSIEASTLEEAIERFPEALSRSVEEMLAAAEELRRQEMTRIVIPGRESAARPKL
ncbi:MAG: hypothetical protein SCH98_11035 [Deferrisomatales bacterium]|nr:hypothetical protein [Deferrisomatales bacterium]